MRKPLLVLFIQNLFPMGLLLLAGAATGLSIATASVAKEFEKAATAYVTNQGHDDGSESSVSVLGAGREGENSSGPDPFRRTAVSALSAEREGENPLLLGFDGPVGIAVHPSGKFAYVAGFNSENVSVIDTTRFVVVRKIFLGTDPVQINFTPNGNLAYVTSRSGPVSVIDTGTNSVVTRVDVSPGSLGLAVTPDGNFAYVSVAGDSKVAVIDARLNEIVTEIPLAGRPSGIAITPDGHFAFVVNTADVSVIDTQTNAILATIPAAAGHGPGVVITPDGQRAYVTDLFSGIVSVIDTQTRKVVATLGADTPNGAAVTPDGAFVYVVNTCANTACTDPGFVSIVHTATNDLVDRERAGINPQWVAVTRSRRHEDDRH
jgi:YVTN family beta-propeller protein